MKFISHSILLFLCSIALVGCSSTEGQLSADIFPERSISLAPKDTTRCTPVTNVTFKDAQTISTEQGDYSLVGIAPLEPTSEQTAQTDAFFATLAENIYCVGNDPNVNHSNLVYIYDKDITLLTTEIIRSGYGTTFEDGAYIYKSYFKGLEQEAKESKSGLHGDGISNTSSESSYVLPESITYAIGGVVTTRFDIASVGNSQGLTYFNSKVDYEDEENIAIQIPDTTDLELYSLYPDRFIGDTVEVKGMVTKVGGKIMIEIEKAEDMRVL